MNTYSHTDTQSRKRARARFRAPLIGTRVRASPVPSSRKCRFSPSILEIRSSRECHFGGAVFPDVPTAVASCRHSRRAFGGARRSLEKKAQRGLRACWPLVRRDDDPRPKRPPPDPVHVLGAAQRSCVPHVGVPERRTSQGAPDGRRRADVQRERQVRQHGGGPPLRAYARAAAPHKRQGLADPRGPSARHDGHRENRGGERTTRRFFALLFVFRRFGYFFLSRFRRRFRRIRRRTARPTRSTNRAH